MTPLVKRAVERLTKHVNLSTGIDHPSDKSWAIDLFKKLRDDGQYINPNEILVFAVEDQGWDPYHAGKLAKLAGQIAEGKNPRSQSHIKCHPQFLDQLKAEIPD